jgi:hypothetical protein
MKPMTLLKFPRGTWTAVVRVRHHVVVDRLDVVGDERPVEGGAGVAPLRCGVGHHLARQELIRE